MKALRVLWTSVFLGGALLGATVSTGAGTAPESVKPPNERLSPAAQKELDTVLADEFCYCGCPHVLNACTKAHRCPHADRMLKLVTQEAKAGASASEIMASLGHYYASFGKTRAVFRADDRQCQGSPSAPVTVVEFSDFQCPFCGAVRPVLESFAKSHSDKVRLCYVPFPLKSHPQAVPAAQAALFARDQGKFWQMHDAIFESQQDLSVPQLKKLAGQLGLNPSALEKAISSNRYQDELNAFKEAGKAAGIEATPTLYFNGRKQTLSYDEPTLVHALEDELEWTVHHGWEKDPS